MARSTHANDLAFPDEHTERGLTKREYFAAQIYASLMGAVVCQDGLSQHSQTVYAMRAVQSADQLIEALNTKTEE